MHHRSFSSPRPVKTSWKVRAPAEEARGGTAQTPDRHIVSLLPGPVSSRGHAHTWAEIFLRASCVYQFFPKHSVHFSQKEHLYFFRALRGHRLMSRRICAVLLPSTTGRSRCSCSPGHPCEGGGCVGGLGAEGGGQPEGGGG